jgi:integrase
MAIRKRGKGHWQVRVRPFPEITVPTREAAQTVELDLKLRARLGHLYREKPVTLGHELDGYVARKEALGGRRGPLRPRSVAFLHQSARPWAPLRKVLIPNLRRAMVEDHLTTRAVVAPVSAGNELELLKACLRAAESRGQSVDPGIFAISPVRHEPVEGVALELERLHEIASTMPERIKRLVPFCGTVGLRFTEAVTLTEDRLDLADGAIVIGREYDKSRRTKTIPLARFETQLLREQLMARPAGTRLVFPNEKGGVYTKSGFRSIWLPALLAAELAHEEGRPAGRTIVVADFRFHWLRHTAISLMARAGMKPELIADRVGHRDGGGLIYRRYRHLFPSEIRSAIGLLDAFVSAESGDGAEKESGH